MLQYTNCPEILLLLLSYFTERNGHLSMSAPVTLPSSLKAVSYSRVELGGTLFALCPVFHFSLSLGGLNTLMHITLGA